MTKHLLNLPVVLTAVFCIAACAVISAIVFGPQSAAPTKLLEAPFDSVPAFTVTDHAGKALDIDDLRGEVWVCDFFLTSCTGICPRLGQSMSDFAYTLSQTRGLGDVQLISFSVDPENDRPDVLALYRDEWQPTWSRGDDARWDTIQSRWRHTTADDQQAFWDIVINNFRLGVSNNNDPKDTSTTISHSSKLVLVDRDGNIRGYYDGLIPEEVEILVADLKRVVAE